MKKQNHIIRKNVRSVLQILILHSLTLNQSLHHALRVASFATLLSQNRVGAHPEGITYCHKRYKTKRGQNLSVETSIIVNAFLII